MNLLKEYPEILTSYMAWSKGQVWEDAGLDWPVVPLGSEGKAHRSRILYGRQVSTFYSSSYFVLYFPDHEMHHSTYSNPRLFFYSKKPRFECTGAVFGI
jgi:hypothetical protein